MKQLMKRLILFFFIGLFPLPTLASTYVSPNTATVEVGITFVEGIPDKLESEESKTPIHHLPQTGDKSSMSLAIIGCLLLLNLMIARGNKKDYNA